MVKSINVSEFIEKVEKNKELVVVDFVANWCTPCSMLDPVFEEVSNEMEDEAKFFKINVNENSSIAQKYEVIATPTIIIFKDGVKVENLAGFMPKDKIIEKVKAYL